MDKDKLNKLFLLPNKTNQFPSIDWTLLGKAQAYYKQFFTEQETPYIVPAYYSQLTKPHHDPTFTLSNGLFTQEVHELVGSAEQGFIYLALHNQLLSNRLFSITPCFRVENYDELHYPWFIKLELFYLSNSYEDIQFVIDLALTFFEECYPGNYKVINTSDISWDITLNDIEIGSYGLRILPTAPHLSFIYGTGLALPRFSQAVQKGSCHG